ncbi:MAG: TIGR04283 family arsenosugar biosynthesis glycosyltransferase [Deltaproteobacteria bacterium]|nr:TIGR04283 family arsenosugar biosynthesis glycosyltransferase [Deltaproteobacteria bacterium]
MQISVIVPALNEEKTIASALEALRPLATEEVIVVDGGSSDCTRELAAQTEAVVLSSSRGRAEQMNQGARVAKGNVLLFLHADTRLPSSAMGDILAALKDSRYVGGRFDVRLDRRGWIFTLIGALINMRSRLTSVATGDQAIFVRRKIFEEVGGFPEIPLMEDIAFSRALKIKGRMACLRSQVVTSARRWEKEGVWRTILKMWALRLLFLAGISPFHLKRFYDSSR